MRLIKNIIIILIVITAMSCSKSDKTVSEQGDITKQEYISQLKKEKDNSYTVEINKNLTIRNIVVKNGEIIFPYNESKGKKFAIIKGDEEPAFSIIDSIEEAVMSYGTGHKIKFTKEFENLIPAGVDISLFKGGKYTPAAFASVAFENGLDISGFKIFETGEDIRIEWPGVNINRNNKQVISVSPEDRSLIEESIISEYNDVSESRKQEETGKSYSRSSYPEKKEVESEVLVLTGIGEEAGGSYAEINGKLKIKGIQVNNKEIIFPYSSSGGRDYPLISTPYRGSSKYINKLKEDIIAKNIVADAGSDLKITNVYVRGGYGKVTFNNAITVNSFKINRNGKVYFPSVREQGRYETKIFITDKKLEQEVIDRLIEKSGGRNQRRYERNRSENNRDGMYNKKKSLSKNKENNYSGKRYKSKDSYRSKSVAKYRKNDIVENVKVFGKGSKGDGIGKLDDGRTIFIENADKGTRVNVKITGVSKKYYFGKVIE